MKVKFFQLFWVLHYVEKQTYKLKFSRKWKIYDIFHVSLLERNITIKRYIDKNNITKLNAGNYKSKKYKVKAIWDNTVYAKESESGYHLAKLYYII